MKPIERGKFRLKRGYRDRWELWEFLPADADDPTPFWADLTTGVTDAEVADLAAVAAEAAGGLFVTREQIKTLIDTAHRIGYQDEPLMEADVEGWLNELAQAVGAER